jgi:TolA-binding protein
MALKISDEAKVQMPMKTVASLIALVAIGTWAFFGIQEKLNQHSTQIEIMDKDLVMNTEFRIKWPRGLLGSLPADSEQFMLIEELYKQIDKLQIRVDGMLHNEVNITALNKAVEKLQSDVEKLKDKQRQFANGNQ